MLHPARQCHGGDNKALECQHVWRVRNNNVICYNNVVYNMPNECHECGGEYQKIGSHWSQSVCEYPEFSNRQHETITGILMGDGYLATRNRFPDMRINMIAKTYLEYLSDDVFTNCSGDVGVKRTAKESAKQSRENGFHPSADVEDYSTLYFLNLVTHPGLQKYKSWYSGGSKVFPEDIELTPTVLRHWYCCDGSIQKNAYPRISLCNEYENREKIEDMFQGAGLVDFRWYGPHYGDEGRVKAGIQFREKGARNFFRYVGEAPPGFGRKWPM